MSAWQWSNSKLSNCQITICPHGNGQIVSSYFSTADQMKNWANEMGYGYIDWNCLNNDSIKKYSK